MWYSEQNRALDAAEDKMTWFFGQLLSDHPVLVSFIPLGSTLGIVFFPMYIGSWDFMSVMVGAIVGCIGGFIVATPFAMAATVMDLVRELQRQKSSDPAPEPPDEPGYPTMELETRRFFQKDDH